MLYSNYGWVDSYYMNKVLYTFLTLLFLTVFLPWGDSGNMPITSLKDSPYVLGIFCFVILSLLICAKYSKMTLVACAGGILSFLYFLGNLTLINIEKVFIGIYPSQHTVQIGFGQLFAQVIFVLLAGAFFYAMVNKKLKTFK